MTIAGRPNRSLIRPATMPITPWCQPPLITVITGAPSCSRACSSACSMTSISIARRSSFRRSSSAAIVARFFRIGRRQQANAEVGLADAAAGVDPRPEREAEVAAARRLHQPRRFGQRGEADILPRRHHPQALGHEGAVEALQPRDVGDRAERDEVEQVEDLGLRAGLEERRGREAREATRRRAGTPCRPRRDGRAPPRPRSRRAGWG